MDLIKHESTVDEAPSTLLVRVPKQEKKFLSIQELIGKVKDFTIEVYGDDVHDIVVEEIRDHHGSYGTRIEVSFELRSRASTSTDSGSDVVFERRKKDFTLNSKTGFIESMRNLK